MPDTDAWWHLRAGAWVLDHGLPPTDPFSFTAAGNRWFQHEWIPEAAMAALARRFGLDSILLLKAVLHAATLAVLWAVAGRALSLAPLARLSVCCLSLASLVPTLTPRPWMFSFLLFAVLVHLWEHPRLGGTAGIVAMGGLLALWMNLHGMYVVGYVWLGLQAAGALADAGFGRPLQVRTRLVRPVAAMAAGCAGALLHPWGAGILTYPLQYHFGELMRGYILEWMPPDMNSAYGRFLLVAFTLTIAAMARAGSPPGDWVVTLALAYLAFTSRRNVALFVLGTVPVLSAAVAVLIAESRRLAAAGGGWRTATVSFLLRRFDNFNAVAVGQARSQFWVLLLVAEAAFFLAVNPARGPARAMFDTPGLTSLQPVEATRVLLARPDVARVRTFNFYSWGGYLIYEGGPVLKTFIDGRTDLFGLDLMKDYQEVAGMGPRYHEVLDRHRIDLVLWPAAHPLRRLLEASDAWRLVHADGTAVLFERVPQAP